jgi:hypothetical protein
MGNPKGADMEPPRGFLYPFGGIVDFFLRKYLSKKVQGT